MLDDFIQVMLAKVYGVAPVSVLKKVYKIYTGAAFKIAELREAQENQAEPTDDNDITTWHTDGKWMAMTRSSGTGMRNTSSQARKK